MHSVTTWGETEQGLELWLVRIDGKVAGLIACPKGLTFGELFELVAEIERATLLYHHGEPGDFDEN